MTAGLRRDDKHQPGDALDRAIDETLGAAMRAHAVDLRERVLSRLDEPADASAAWWRFVLRPALLPAAGAALLVVGVVLTWQHVDNTLTRIGSRQPTASVARAKPGAARTSPGVAPAPKAGASGASEARASLPPSPSGLRRTSVTAAESDRVILAASLLDMDAMSEPAPVAADTVLMGDDVEQAPTVPGAAGGDLGEPIKPMPPLRPIVIQPIVPAPIVEAPPVSTLAPTVSTLPTVGEISRDPSDPGKPGGVRQ